MKSDVKISEGNDIQRDNIGFKKSLLNLRGWIHLVIIIIFVYLSTMIITNYFTIYKYNNEKIQLSKKLESTKEEIKGLELYIKNVENPEFVEKIARENLKMVKPNEKVYIVIK